MGAGGWQKTIIARSTNEKAFVLGVRSGREVLAALAPTNGPDGALYGICPASGAWALLVMDTNVSHMGLGTMFHSRTLEFQNGMRLLDSGGLQAPFEFPTNELRYCEQDKTWCFKADVMEWSNAVSHAELYGGFLVTITNVIKNRWVSNYYSKSSWVRIGLHRTGGPWEWHSGAPFGYTSWASGEPDALPVVVMSNDKWADASVGSSYPSVVEVQSLFARRSEPVVTNPWLWRGSSLASGTIRVHGTNRASVFYACLDDANGSASIDAGDVFVVAEFVGEGTNMQCVTQTNIAIVCTTPAASYGLACVDYTNSDKEVLFTGEPDGRISSWAAPSSVGPLRRRLFSAQYLGRAWHALAGCDTVEPGEGLVGLCVDPTNPVTCDVVFWGSERELWQASDIAQTAPLTRIMAAPSTGGGYSAVSVKIWDGEGNKSLPVLQWSEDGVVWSNATLYMIDGVPYMSVIRVEAMPTGSVHSLVWNAQADLGSVTNTVWLRTRSVDVSLWGEWSESVQYHVAVTGDLDIDDDGLPDTWEVAGGLDPTRASGDDGPDGDPDGDGLGNIDEFIADTHPSDPESALEIVRLKFEAGGLRLTWRGGQLATQYLQLRAGLDATGTSWQVIHTNLPPTPITNTIVDAGATNQSLYYRLRAVKP